MVSLPSSQQISNVLIEAVPKARSSPIVASAERIFQPITDFIRSNPILSTAAISIGTTGLVAGATSIIKRRKSGKKKTTRKKRTTRKRTKKKTKAQLKRIRLRNLTKARRCRKKKGKRRIVRGRGLGTHEIRHSGKSTKGKMKIVSFRDKRTGKMVRFKARR